MKLEKSATVYFLELVCGILAKQSKLENLQNLQKLAKLAHSKLAKTDAMENLQNLQKTGKTGTLKAGKNWHTPTSNQLESLLQLSSSEKLKLINLHT